MKTEDDSKFAKKICISCYNQIGNYKRNQKNPQNATKEILKGLKLIFNNIFYFPIEDDFKHRDNCKVCVNNETEKVNVQTPHVQNISVPLKHQKLKGKI